MNAATCVSIEEVNSRWAVEYDSGPVPGRWLIPDADDPDYFVVKEYECRREVSGIREGGSSPPTSRRVCTLETEYTQEKYHCKRHSAHPRVSKTFKKP
nr:MAG TPA: hypothetical protein [Caudoviricetes sp.]